MRRIIIIGAGASGLIAGAQAAKRGLDVTIVERNSRPARKVMITGKGRCNVTNACFDINELISNVVRNPRFMYSAFSSFMPYDTMALLQDMGVETKIERGNRVFPVSDKAVDIVDALVKNAKQSGAKIVQGCVASFNIENGIVKNSNVRDSLFPKFISSSSQINYGEYIVIAGLPSVNINNPDNMVVFTTTGPDEFLEKLDKHIKKLHLKVRDSGFSMCQCISDEYMRIFNEERNLKMECIPLADNPYKTGSTAYKCYGRAVFAAMDEMIKDDMRSLRGKISYNVDTRMFSKGISIQTYIPSEKERIIISYFHEGRDYILSDFVHSASDGSLADKPLGDYFICDNPDVKRCIAATAEVMWKYEKTSYENLIDIMNGFFNKEAYDYNNGKEIFSIDSPETAIEKLKSIRIDRHGHLNYEKKYTMANYYRMIAVLKCPDETDINYINNVVIGEMVNDGVKEKHISEILKIMAEKACIPFNKNYIYSEIDKHIAFNKAKKQFNSKKLKQLKGERNG